MSVQPNRLHDLARGLYAWSTRPDGYNYRVVDQAFVDRMRDGKASIADYQHIKAEAAERARQIGYCTLEGCDPDFGSRMGIARDLEAMRRALAEHPGIAESLAAEPSAIARLWAGLQACLFGNHLKQHIVVEHHRRSRAEQGDFGGR